MDKSCVLVVDVGNSNIVIALCSPDQILCRWRLATDRKKSVDEYRFYFLQMLQESAAKYEMSEKTLRTHIVKLALASVVPSLTPILSQALEKVFACESYCELHVVGHSRFMPPLAIDLPDISEIGADRLLNAYGALVDYGAPCLVIDFGTATTFDVVDAEKRYAGGAIAPGLELSLQSLVQAAAKLDMVDLATVDKAIGKSTRQAMQSGLFWGYLGLIEKITTQITNELMTSDIPIILTGGLAQFFHRSLPFPNHFAPDLTVNALRKMAYDV